MPRIRPLTREEVAPELLPILDRVEQLFGSLHAGTCIFAYCPPILQASHALGAAITRSGTVPSLIRALVMLRVAQMAECPFRTDTNAVSCRQAGAPAETIDAVSDFRRHDCFTPAERAALAVAEGMTRTPVDVSDAAFEEARRHFNDQQLVELAATIASENYRVRFNRAFGVESLGLY